MSDVVRQVLSFQDWPLDKPGDEKFFGYLIAVGVFPREWAEEDGLIRYADFAYNDGYTRYRLPNDMRLVELLYRALWDNLGASFAEGGIYGKFWIKRTTDGYSLDLP